MASGYQGGNWSITATRTPEVRIFIIVNLAALSEFASRAAHWHKVCGLREYSVQDQESAFQRSVDGRGGISGACGSTDRVSVPPGSILSCVLCGVRRLTAVGSQDRAMCQDRACSRGEAGTREFGSNWRFEIPLNTGRG